MCARARERELVRTADIKLNDRSVTELWFKDGIVQGTGSKYCTEIDIEKQ